ncbi:MAG TPA: restriction endonuclease subunit S, partial [bacterium]|nr:restriction endonuclease subunit S [bacterium]
MKLDKSKWHVKKLSDCCNILDNFRKPISATEREKRIKDKDINQLYPYYGATGQVGWIDDYLIDDEFVLIGEDGAPFFDKSKDIAYFIKGKAWVNNHAHILKAKINISNNFYILYYLNSFNDFGKYVNGTTRLKLNKGQLEKIPVKIPPLAEQNQIAELFQSIDTAIEQAETQENNLKILQVKLCDGLTSEKPEFGKLLNTKNWMPNIFDDFVDCIEQH